jgi:hypothetical protein
MTSDGRLDRRSFAGRAFASCLAVAAIAAVLAPLPARAESRSEEDCTPLALLRRAGVAVLARGAAPAPDAEPGTVGVLVVEEVLRGGAKAGDRLEVAASTDREDARVPPGGRWVAVLDPRPDGRWTLVAGGMGLFDCPEGPAGASSLEILRALVEHGVAGLPAEGPGRAALRAALVRATGEGDARLRSGAALDLLREPGLLGSCTAGEREALARAFVAAGPTDVARGHLVRALAILKVPGTAERIAGALAGPGGGILKRQAGLALKDLEDPDAVRLVAARLAGANPAVRVAVAGALGWSTRKEARPALEALLADAAVPVRLEAIVGLGRLRAPEAAAALLRRFRNEDGTTPGPERDARLRRAVAWALAQCDEGEAWAALRRARDSDPELGYRSFLGDLLANPRREFVR